jgi:hypothetical protein
MSVRILCKINKCATEEEIDNLVIGFAHGMRDLCVFFEGFIYEPNIGIWVFGPRKEIEKVSGEGRYIEEFNIEEYVKNTKDKVFWLMDYSNPSEPKLLKMAKS